MARIFILFLSLFIVESHLINAQITVSGKVLSAGDSLPIPGASIYFDGTSIGISSREDGHFTIIADNNTTSILVIQALGFKTNFVQNQNKSGDLGTIFLEESQESLGEVHLETDPWSRQKKLEIFRREFLGNDLAAKQSRIKNEEAINLRYIPSTQTLVAFADEPIKIVNRFLGYEVTYNLTDFKAEFSSASGLRLTTLVYHEGYSFFKEIRKKPSKRFLKNRENTFKGSSLHFLRSLAAQKLVENNFRIFLDGFEVPPYAHFRITPHGQIQEIELLQEKLIIVYEPLVQSAIHAQGKFYVDVYGNHTPPQIVIFSGEMSKSRVAGLLPLNYKF